MSVVLKKIKCPRCSSDKVIKNGFKNRIQTYKCKNCGRCFSEHYKPRKKHYKQYKKRKKSYIIPERKTIVEADIRNVIDVPCFSCGYLEKSCKPSSCDELFRWLS